MKNVHIYRPFLIDFQLRVDSTIHELYVLSIWRLWFNRVVDAMTSHSASNATLPSSTAHCPQTPASTKYSAWLRSATTVPSAASTTQWWAWSAAWCLWPDACGSWPRSRCSRHRPSSTTFSTWEICPGSGRALSTQSALSLTMRRFSLAYGSMSAPVLLLTGM